MKRLIKRGIAIYLFPILSNKKMKAYVQNSFFVPEIDYAEHLKISAKYILSKWDKSDDTKLILDIGSADGGTCHFFATHFPKNKVLGFEPNADFYQKGIEKCKELAHVIIKNIALNETVGKATLHITNNLWSSSLKKLNTSEIKNKSAAYQKLFDEVESREVPVSTLDTEIPSDQSILLLKIDTQGTELGIFRGGLETLKRTKYVLTEMNNHHLYEDNCQYYEMDDFLRLHHFKLVRLFSTFDNEFDALYENENV